MKGKWKQIICLALVLCTMLVCGGCGIGGKKVSRWDVLTFGRYPQTAEGTDSTPIEWYVIDIQGNKAMVISKFGLDAKPFNTEDVSVKWETSSLRKWLNEDFMNAAFNEKEQRAIYTTTVYNGPKSNYMGYWTPEDPDTQDKIFLLSFAEAKQHLWVDHIDVNKDAKENYSGRIAPTPYAIQQGAWKSSKDKIAITRTGTRLPSGRWWLRSPGPNPRSNGIACVNSDGSLCSTNVATTYVCVCPVLWVDLNSGIFQ